MTRVTHVPRASTRTQMERKLVGTARGTHSTLTQTPSPLPTANRVLPVLKQEAGLARQIRMTVAAQIGLTW